MDPWYGMPELCRTIAGFGREQAPVDLLRHKEVLSEELQIPNVHGGCMHFALFHRGFEHGLYLGMFQGLCHGAHAVLNPVTPWDDTLTRSDFIEILVAYARSRKEAMELLLKLRFYDPRNTKRDPRDVAAATVVKPGEGRRFRPGMRSRAGSGRGVGERERAICGVFPEREYGRHGFVHRSRVLRSGDSPETGCCAGRQRRRSRFPIRLTVFYLYDTMPS